MPMQPSRLVTSPIASGFPTHRSSETNASELARRQERPRDRNARRTTADSAPAGSTHQQWMFEDFADDAWLKSAKGRNWSLAETCSALQEAPHILRQWERDVIDGAQGLRRKGERGFPPAVVGLLALVRHLVRDKGLRLRAARNQLLGMAPDALDARAHARFTALLRDEICAIRDWLLSDS